MTGIDIGLIIAVVSALAGAIAWYRNYTREAYARERKLGHIENHIKQHSESINVLFRDAEETLNELNQSDRMILRELSELRHQIAELTIAVHYQSQGTPPRYHQHRDGQTR